MKYPWIDDYLLGKKGAAKDFNQERKWVRYLVGDRLFCVVGLDDDGKPVYISVKLNPFYGDALQEKYPDIEPAYNLNKIYWNSVNADGQVPEEVMREMLDKSYDLVLSCLSKKKQLEIQNGGNKNESL